MAQINYFATALDEKCSKRRTTNQIEKRKKNAKKRRKCTKNWQTAIRRDEKAKKATSPPSDTENQNYAPLWRLLTQGASTFTALSKDALCGA